MVNLYEYGLESCGKIATADPANVSGRSVTMLAGQPRKDKTFLLADARGARRANFGWPAAWGQPYGYTIIEIALIQSVVADGS